MTDVDEVLLGWREGISAYVKKNYPEIEIDEMKYDQNIPSDRFYDLINEFNDHDSFSYLEPTRNSEKYVPHIKKLGYKFVAVTTCLGTEKTRKLRENNLKRVFGADTFFSIICLPVGSSKEPALKSFAPTIYIDDKRKHCESSIRAGHTTCQMTYHYDKDAAHEKIIPVDDWSEIYTLVKSLS